MGYSILLYAKHPRNSYYKLIAWHPTKELVLLACSNDNEIIELDIQKVKSQSMDIVIKIENVNGVQVVQVFYLFHIN